MQSGAHFLLWYLQAAQACVVVDVVVVELEGFLAEEVTGLMVVLFMVFGNGCVGDFIVG